MSQIALTFPDGSVRHYDKGVTVDQVAASIGSSLAKATLAGKFQGQLVDHDRPLEADGTIEIITDKSPEALEIIVHGNENTSHVIGREIGELKLPTGALIGAVLRGNDVLIGNNQMTIQEGDHVVVYLSDKKYISDLEKLFQPSAFFI